MHSFGIGVMADSFKTSPREAIKKAKALGADGVQIYAVRGPMDPDNMDNHDRSEFLKYVKDQGLTITALCGDLGGHGFSIEDDNKRKIEKSKRIIDLAKDLETEIVTTHIGVVPEDPSNERYKVMQDACGELGSYAESMDAFFAIETGPEKTDTLKRFLDSLGNKGMGVNYDPANLVMVAGDDPVAGVHTLRDYIVHTHAKDGIMKKQGDPERIYAFFAEGGIEDMRLEDYFIETPLGEGMVDFPNYLDALTQIGYRGYLTIEREVGGNPAEDIKQAVIFLKKLMSR